MEITFGEQSFHSNNDSYQTKTISYLLDHIHELGFRRVLPEGSHDCSQFLGCDGTCVVLVREWGGGSEQDFQSHSGHPWQLLFWRCRNDGLDGAIALP